MRLQVFFSLFSTYFSNFDSGLDPLTTSRTALTSPLTNGNTVNKSIVIVGAGSGGLAILKVLTELPDEARQSLEFVLLEEREDVGGIWLPNNHVSYPPELPETPLYPRLRTNSAVPMMTYPNFTFPPGTPLYPNHTYVLSYHQRFASQFNLYSHIEFNHRVMEANWIGTSQKGQWNLTMLNSKGVNETRMADHLVVATGNSHIPNVPSWPGQDNWLQQVSDREILHSIYYRYPGRYTNRTVLVVGGGFSGNDAAEQISPLAKKVYVSLRSPLGLGVELPPNVELKPDISHFTNNSIVFKDNSEIKVDSVLLATGYQLRKPFLEAGNTMTLDVDLEHHVQESMDNDVLRETSKLLRTNRKYIYPMYRHIFSLSPLHPSTALSFIGVPAGIITHCYSDYAQSLFITNLIMNPTIVPSREEMFSQLAAEEQYLRDNGLNPYVAGHRLINGLTGPNDYEDELVDFLKEKGVIPSSTPKFVTPWRRDMETYLYLRRGWWRIEQSGQEEEWLRGVETESQWADLMARINAWQRDWENENNVPFVYDYPRDEFGELYVDDGYW